MLTSALVLRDNVNYCLLFYIMGAGKCLNEVYKEYIKKFLGKLLWVKINLTQFYDLYHYLKYTKYFDVFL